MNAVGERLGIAVEWRDTGGFDNIIPGLKTGRYDVALSNINATPTRLNRSTLSATTTPACWELFPEKTPVSPRLNHSVTSAAKRSAPVPVTQVTRLEEASKACEAAGKQPIKVAIFPDRPAGVQAVVSGRVPLFLGRYEGFCGRLR